MTTHCEGMQTCESNWVTRGAVSRPCDLQPHLSGSSLETCPNCAGKAGASLTDLSCGLTLHLGQAGCGSVFLLGLSLES